jgi:hypothetical protein
MTVAEADNIKPKAIAAPKPAPVEIAEPVEPVAEPVKRSSKKTEEAAEKPDLSKILAEWDD